MLKTKSSFAVRTWRDADPAVREASEYFGHSAEYDLSAERLLDPVGLSSELFREGVRRVQLLDPDPVGDDDGLRFLSWINVLGQLSAQGVVVDWCLRWAGAPEDLRAFRHLPPPREVEGSAETLAVVRDWTDWWQLLLLSERFGPGLIGVNDKRQLPTLRFVINDPDELATIQELRTPERYAADGFTQTLIDHRLVGVVQEFALWLPIRIRRWPVVARGVSG